jgi:hypothetical protein
MLRKLARQPQCSISNVPNPLNLRDNNEEIIIG